MQSNQKKHIYLDHLNTWGIIFVLLGLFSALIAYYTHIDLLRLGALSLIISGLIFLLLSMKYDLQEEIKSSLLSFLAMFTILALYFYFRTALHRFDFGVGDASDYYVAGVCSVTYGQDIGFFLPLTASVSAIGYAIFGAMYAPYINIILYAVSIPVGYFLLRKLHFTPLLSFIVTIFLTLTPLSIWFSRTSFSEPIWQLLLLIFTYLAYQIVSTENFKLKTYLALLLLLLLLPFLRGEAALYYGLIIFLSFYHFWKYNKLKPALLISVGLIILALSIHYTLGIRAHYLLKWQFSRIIPNITEMTLMSILYSVSLLGFILIILLSKIKILFTKLNFPLVLTFLAVLVKIIIAYLYASKKNLAFLDLLFSNEFGLALGNFGLPITMAIIFGLILLHYRAIKGDFIALTLVVLYAIFYLPFVMQGVTFHDAHELFLYWNRYYFSIFMIIHVVSLALVLKFIYDLLEKWIKNTLIRSAIIAVFLTLLMFFSMSYKLHNIVTSEAYLENSNKVFTWVKKRVGTKNLSVLYDTDIKYRRHNGQYDAKVFVSRAFTVARIFAKKYQKINPTQLNTKIALENEMTKYTYLLCISSKPCGLKNEELTLLDSTMLPISWREHYMAHPKSKEDLQGDVTKSLKNYLDLYLTLYKVKKH
jgi:hypothetical protein